MAALTDDQLKAKQLNLKNVIKMENHWIHCFMKHLRLSVRCQTCPRSLPYKVQVMGGIVLHHGDVPEDAYREGKTLTATMPVYLNALSGKGVHVVTVNEYLSERDATEMGELYSWLGLSVGINLAAKSQWRKRSL